MSRVLVTGASRGIGRAVVRELAARGHYVVAKARTVASAQDLPAAARLALDVTDQESVDKAIAAAGEVDALISNAGETLRAPVASTPLAEVEPAWFSSTPSAACASPRQSAGHARPRPGPLPFVSSILGRIAIPLSGAYAASKRALEALAETLAIETGHFGVKVTLLEPEPFPPAASTGTDAARRRRPVPAAGLRSWPGHGERRSASRRPPSRRRRPGRPRPTLWCRRPCRRDCPPPAARPPTTCRSGSPRERAKPGR